MKTGYRKTESRDWIFRKDEEKGISRQKEENGSLDRMEKMYITRQDQENGSQDRIKRMILNTE